MSNPNPNPNPITQLESTIRTLNNRIDHLEDIAKATAKATTKYLESNQRRLDAQDEVIKHQAETIKALQTKSSTCIADSCTGTATSDNLCIRHYMSRV